MGTCVNSVTVNAPPDVVWNRLKNFHDASWSQGVVTSLDKVGSVAGDQVGAKRIINKAFHETLLSLDDAHKTFTYSIDDGPEPVSKSIVSKYVAKVVVQAGKDPGTTKVDWNSEFTSTRDKDVADFCNPIYGALLAGMKKTFAS